MYLMSPEWTTEQYYPRLSNHFLNKMILSRIVAISGKFLNEDKINHNFHEKL